MWVAISFAADLLPKKWFWNSSRCEWRERVFFCSIRNEKRPLVWDPSDKDRELVFPLSRHSSVFMSDYGVSINGKIEKIHSCIRTLVKIKVVFFFSLFLKEMISSSFQLKEKINVYSSWFGVRRPRFWGWLCPQSSWLSKPALLSGSQFTLAVKRGGLTLEALLQGETQCF